MGLRQNFLSILAAFAATMRGARDLFRPKAGPLRDYPGNPAGALYNLPSNNQRRRKRRVAGGYRR